MRKILILFSDTGGGHRAAAEAIRDAVKSRYGDCYEVVLEDGIVNAAVPPFNLIPKLYLPVTTYSPWGWGFLFHSTNSRWGRTAIGFLAWLLASRGLSRIIREVNPDLVLTVHPLLTRVPRNIWKKLKPCAPFITVVTDLFDAHATWFSTRPDLTIVPTEGAKQRAIRWGLPSDGIRVVGLPVSLKFASARQPAVNGDREALAALRTRLGLRPDLFTILIVGGGEGMGRIEETARVLAGAGLPIQLAVIAGRNQKLRQRLEALSWPIPVRVTGFVTNMPDWMRASDLVVTKAGPGTIMETLAAGRPLLLSGYLPGQEEGNVTFVEQAGVGVYRRTPQAVAEQVREWLSPGNHALAEMKARARAEARPDAALEVAALLDELIRTAPAHQPQVW